MSLTDQLAYYEMEADAIKKVWRALCSCTAGVGVLDKPSCVCKVKVGIPVLLYVISGTAHRWKQLRELTSPVPSRSPNAGSSQGPLQLLLL